MRNRRPLFTLVGAVLLAAASLGLPGSASAATGPTATFGKTAAWSGGYQAQYTITAGNNAIHDWTVQITLPSADSVSSAWDATLSSSGGTDTFTAKSYNADVAAGSSVTFGFVVSGDDAPTGCTLDGAACDGSDNDTQPPTAPAGVTVTAHTSNTVTLGWQPATDNVGVTGYRVYRGDTQAATSTTTSAVVSGLEPSTTYHFTVRAVDAAGNVSPDSKAVSATTKKRGASGVLMPVAPYVDMGSWPTPTLADMTAGGGIKSFTLAFITGASCKASWFNAYDPASGWQKDQVDAVRAAGGDVKISFGGEAGITLAQACDSPQAVVAQIQPIIDAYGADYLDFDIEGSAVADQASVDRRSAALATLQQDNPGLKVSLTLPVLPEGLTADGLDVVTSAIAAGVQVDMVNVMAMDYYRSGTDYGDAAIQAATSTEQQLAGLYPGKSSAQLWQMIGITPMIGQNDDKNVFSLDDARQLVSFAKQHHPGMLAFWEMTRDRNACTGSLFKCTNVPQQPYDFSTIFNTYTG